MALQASRNRSQDQLDTRLPGSLAQRPVAARERQPESHRGREIGRLVGGQGMGGGKIGDPAESARLVAGDEVDRQHLKEVEEWPSISRLDTATAGCEVDHVGGFQGPEGGRYGMPRQDASQAAIDLGGRLVLEAEGERYRGVDDEARQRRPSSTNSLSVRSGPRLVLARSRAKASNRALASAC